MTKEDETSVTRSLSKYVMGKIIPLQNGYFGNGPAASTARGDLAQLRRFSASDGNAWMTVGDLLFEGWPEDELGPLTKEKKLTERTSNAVRATLSLYAIHQQSKESPMCLVREKGEGDWSAGSFGRACRLIEPDLEVAKGVQRRLARIEATEDFDGALVNVRALIQLLKAKSIPLDYGRLAQDLYLIQTSKESRRKVFRRWASEYYAPIRTQDNEAN